MSHLYWQLLLDQNIEAAKELALRQIEVGADPWTWCPRVSYCLGLLGPAKTFNQA